MQSGASLIGTVMTTCIVTHTSCLGHDTGPKHPETPERLRLLLDELKNGSGFEDLVWKTAPLVEQGQLRRVHDPAYIQSIVDAEPKEGRMEFEPSGTVITSSTLTAALHAAGSVCLAVDEVMTGKADNAFCAVRPPGHHTESARTSGFCFFNNVAVGVRHAQVAHKVTKAAILDFDVHHGNGTQEIFNGDQNILFTSIHQAFIFPRLAQNIGSDGGNVVNVSVGSGLNGEKFAGRVEKDILPKIRDFEPEILFLSAGFDAHTADPLGGLKLSTPDYYALTKTLVALAKDICGGRIVSVLEGGYNPSAVSAAGAAHVRALSEN